MGNWWGPVLAPRGPPFPFRALLVFSHAPVVGDTPGCSFKFCFIDSRVWFGFMVRNGSSVLTTWDGGGRLGRVFMLA